MLKTYMKLVEFLCYDSLQINIDEAIWNVEHLFL